MRRTLLLVSMTWLLHGCGGSDSLEVTSETLSPGVQGVAYSALITASGGSEEGYVWTISSGALPPGITLAAEGTPSASLTGTPEAPGDFSFTVGVTDSAGARAERAMTFVVSSGQEELQITTQTLPAATVGLAYSAEIRAQGGKGTGYLWQIVQGVLPDGLSLAATGSPATLLTGTPTMSGDFTFSVEVSDGTAQHQYSFTLIVQAQALPLSIDAAALSDAQVGVMYQASVQAQGGSGEAYTWSIVSGALPAGLSLTAQGTPSTQISGLPLEFGVFTFDVQVEDSEGAVATEVFTLQVSPAVLRVVTSSLPQGSVNAPFTAMLRGSGGTEAGYAWTVSAGSLPQGLVLQPLGTPGVVLSGTPAAFGSFDFTVHLQDGAGAEAEADLQIVVLPALTVDNVALARGRQGQSYLAHIQALDGADTGYAWSLVQGILPAGLQLSGVQTATLTLSGVPTEFGEWPLTFAVVDAHGGLASRDFSLVIDPVGVQIRTTSVALGVMNEPYLSTVHTQDGSGQGYTWSAQGLPPGLSVASPSAPSTQISGQPTAFGTFTATVTVTDINSDSASRTLSFDIAPPAVVISTATLPGATYGVPYTAQVIGALGAEAGYQWSIAQGGLPFGLALDPQGTPASAISGIPQEVGSFNLSVMVVDDNGQSAVADYVLTVTRDLSIETRALATAEVGAAYAQPLEAAGGAPPYTWSVAAGALPSGLNLSTVGSVTSILGTPTVPSAARFTLEVQDGGGGTARRSFLLSPVAPQRWAVTVGDTVVNNDSLVVLVDIAGAAPTGYLTVNPAAAGFGDASSDLNDAQFAPNNQRLAHIGDFISDAVSEVFLVELSSGSPVGPTLVNDPLVVGGDVQDILWSPDSSRLLYSADQVTDNVTELFVVDVVGGVSVPRRVSPPLPITGDVSTRDFWWSPDARWVAMLADASADGDNELYVTDVSVPGILNPVRVHGALPPGGDVDDRVVFMPDGSGMVFLGDLNVNAQQELFFVDLSGQVPGTPRRLNLDLPLGGNVAFDRFALSPDGRRLLFVASQGAAGGQDLFVINLALSVPSAPVQVNAPRADSSMRVYSGVWAPDSARIAYAGGLADPSVTELFIADVSGLQPVPSGRLSRTLPGLDRDVVSTPGTGYGWSPDGQWLAYRADHRTDNASDLFAIEMSGPVTSSTVVLLNPPLPLNADVDVFRFAPDSQRLIYIADQNVVNQAELFVVDLSGPSVGAAVQVNRPMPLNGDVDTRDAQLRWSRDSRRVFYRSDEQVNNDSQARVSDVSGAVPTPSLLFNPSLPANGDVSYFVLSH